MIVPGFILVVIGAVLRLTDGGGRSRSRRTPSLLVVGSGGRG